MHSQDAVPNVEYIEAQTGIDPSYSVIWMHGLGADGYDFEPIVPVLKLPAGTAVRFIFPHAPMRPITVNGGMSMRGWYDIKEWSFNRNEDVDGMEESRQIINALIEQENNRGIVSERIFLAGFSQGGAMTLFAGLRYPQKLAGFIALSCYLPLSNETAEEKSDVNQDTPIFMGHGTEDPTIPVVLAELSKDKLEKLGYGVEWKTYDMPHSVHPDELDDVSRFITNVIQTSS